VIRSPMPWLLLALLAACAGAPKENYYTLNAEAAAGVQAAGPFADAGITVLATGLVEAVDRPQIVARLSDTRVEILEQQRWAEPLRAAIPRVVATNLSRLLGSAGVTSQSQPPLGETAYRIALDVQRFAGNVVKGGRSSVTERASGPGYDALAAAHSRALASVSRDIAAALATMQ
jgi:uncharacterized protein